MRIRRFGVYKGSLRPRRDGNWVKYEDMQAYIKNLIETISIPWNIQLTTGGALNETSGEED